MDKQLRFWLNRVLQEKCIKIKDAQERISIISHQLNCFDDMDERWQKEVINDLALDMINFSWHKEVDDLGKHLKYKKGELSK